MLKETTVEPVGRSDFHILIGSRIIGYIAATGKKFVANSVFIDTHREYSDFEDALTFLQKETERFVEDVLQGKINRYVKENASSFTQ
ncbi:MAG: hypothetical protein JXR36_04115 [Bacteroidales bacterium]|nr:hypothetical protein [Bacteroidales bacterium]